MGKLIQHSSQPDTSKHVSGSLTTGRQQTTFAKDNLRKEASRTRGEVNIVATQAAIVIPDANGQKNYFVFSAPYHLGEPSARLIKEGVHDQVAVRSTDFVICAGIKVSVGASYGLIHAMGASNGVELLSAVVNKLKESKQPLDSLKIEIHTISSPEERGDAALYEKEISRFLVESGIKAQVSWYNRHGGRDQRIQEIIVYRP